MPSHERQVTILALVSPLPPLAIALALLWTGGFEPRTQWTLSILLVALWLILAAMLRERVVRPLQTLSNMLAAIREQDYSLRGRRAGAGDALGLAMLELNSLMDELRERRLGALEATALLRRVMAEIDVAVFAFDDEGALRLVNAAGERLLGAPAERLLGRRADELGLAACLDGDAPRIVELALGAQRGRWEMRRGAFRQGGRPHQFVMLADVSRALREEERKAWQRLIRVLGHEINNSIAPIKSLAEQFRDLLHRRAPDDAMRDDMERGLGVIANRSEALTRFLASYTRLAKLPAPRLAPMDVAAWTRRIAQLETRLAVEVRPGPDVTLLADGDQLDQALINLVRNAADAALETGGGVRIGWAREGSRFALTVQDDGPWLPKTSNLFVPFFTTKPGGSGIGLVLTQQIAEAHGGTVALSDRADGHGCEARLVLPC
ncbi:MAG: PAS domain-containing protein [Gemmatimonadota bacterium]|nr:PAS domain-containing protein [Gemmatimonadota bacterium]